MRQEKRRSASFSVNDNEKSKKNKTAKKKTQKKKNEELDPRGFQLL